MVTHRATISKVSKKTTKSLEALRQRKVSLSNKTRSTVNKKDSQVLSYVLTCTLGKAA